MWSGLYFCPLKGAGNASGQGHSGKNMTEPCEMRSLSQWSPTFQHQVHCIYCALYVCDYYISSTSDPGSRGPLLSGIESILPVLSVSTCMCAKSLQSCLILYNPMDYSPQAPLSMGFSRQGYWSALPCPPPEDLPNPGFEPASPVSPALQEDSLLLSYRGSPFPYIYTIDTFSA